MHQLGIRVPEPAACDSASARDPVELPVESPVTLLSPVAVVLQRQLQLINELIGSQKHSPTQTRGSLVSNEAFEALKQRDRLPSSGS